MTQSAQLPHPPPAFTPGAVIGIIVAALAALCAFVALSTFHADLGGGDDNGGPNALSRSAVGYAGLVSLLRARGDEVVISRVEDSLVTHGVLIVTPPPSATAEDIGALSIHGAKLVMARKWRAAPSRERQGWVSKAGLIRGDDTRIGDLADGTRIRNLRGRAPRNLVGAPDGPLAGLRLTTAEIDLWQAFAPSPALEPILLDEAGGVVIGRLTSDRATYLVSEPDLFSSQGLKTLQGARTATAIIDRFNTGQGAVVFDVTLNGFGREKRSLMRALLTPPLLPATLCLLMSGLVMGAHAFGRFGPTKAAGRVYALGKRALADNMAALVALAGREHRTGGGYAQLTREAVLEAVGAPRDMSAEAADEFLDRLGATRGVLEPWTALKAQAEQAKDTEALGRIARKLYSWKLEMTREHR